MTSSDLEIDYGDGCVVVNLVAGMLAGCGSASQGIATATPVSSAPMYQHHASIAAGHGSMPKRSASSRNSGRGRSPESWARSRVTSRASRWVRVSSGAICSAPCRSRSALPSWRRMACAAARSVRTGTSPGTSTRRNTLRSGGKAQPETADARS
jgi:hypothetical protein